MRRPGVEPGSTAWKATMLTVTPPTHICTITEWLLFAANRIGLHAFFTTCDRMQLAGIVYVGFARHTEAKAKWYSGQNAYFQLNADKRG